MEEQVATYVRSTAHSLKFANVGKQAVVVDFLLEYRKAVDTYVKFLWNNPREWNPGKILDIEHDYLAVPSMISTTDIPIETRLCGRALKCAATQACGIVKSALKRRSLDLKIKATCLEENKPLPKRVAERLEHTPSIPKTENVNAEINSVCCTVEKGRNTFDWWIELKSMFNPLEYGRGFTVELPLKRTSQDNKWSKGEHEVLPSILLTQDTVYIRYRRPVPKATGTVVGGLDQGGRTLLSFSDGTKLPKIEHDMMYCMKRITRTKRGSKNHQRALEERDNYIGRMCNTVDWSKYKELAYERHFDTKRGKNVGRLLTAFCNPQIRERIVRRASEEMGVPITETDNVCNSLRCPMDGWVHEKNRPKKGKIFRCMKCGYVDDDDEVAAFNNRAHLEGLPDCSHVLVFTWKLHKKSGFFWTNEGFFDEKGNPISEVGSLQSPIGQD